MDDKTKLELYERLDCLKKEERDKSDATYARKLAEVLIFSFTGMALIALIGTLFKLVILQ